MSSIVGEYKALEWNIAGRSGQGGRPVDMIVREILKREADFVILTEFVETKETPNFKSSLEKEGYLVFTTKPIRNKNGILIAVHSKKVVAASAEGDLFMDIINKGPNFLRVNAELKPTENVELKPPGKKIALIGVRMRTNKDTRKIQAGLLRNHIAGCKTDTSVLCMGDFNASKESLVDKDALNMNPENCEMYSPGSCSSAEGVSANTCADKELLNWSYVSLGGKKLSLDHMFISKDCSCKNYNYDWSFVNPDNGYNTLTSSDYLSEKTALPDHAILTGTITIHCADT